MSTLALLVLGACGANEAQTEQAPAAPSTVAASSPVTTAPLPSTSTPPSSPTAAPQTTAPQTTAPSTAAPLPAGTTACDSPGVGGYDLLGYSVDKSGKSISFNASFTPIAPGHDVLLAFTTPGSSKRVAGELFEDGSGVAQVQDLTSLDTVYLDGPQGFGDDHVQVNVPRQAIDNRLIKDPLTVELKVDGAAVETCTAGS